MTFADILARMSLASGISGHGLDIKSSLHQGDGYKPEYLSNAEVLYKNPVLAEEIERQVKVLTDGLMEVSSFEDVIACRLAIKSILTFYDNLKMLHDVSIEEREKKRESDLGLDESNQEDNS